ncbi:aminotransferase class I/II-fold pyridoxal phosphate-dependent enzyme [Nocardiopsis alborubida]|uniref:Aminotransferase class I/II-fold pyridoxal phosphate-dependent enzyme n=1 Tax=Nocardiopsis alborubida TaxID=146802 RepID=A0A7X6RNZ9_9ACTN|nr:aminotransferase class I/II-fold pyridoxal phosphate-dependent enzyme [Nocardiopsis alborubida]NKY96641.1 aminotransferase class I/II-fold pyridoxal phosphate-dependent enzyme [Nocardiopsis alborubida]
MPGLDSAVYQYSTLTSPAQTAAAQTLLASGKLSSIGGHHLQQLESRVAMMTGRSGAMSCASASAAVELVLRALDLGPGDEVIVPEVAWVSLGAAIDHVGAQVQVAPAGTDLTPRWEDLVPLIGPSTRAVILAHLRGRPAADIDRITEELRRRDILMIEDCAQAWGVTAAGRPAGARGTVAVFSLNHHKLVSTGEGGVVVTDDTALLERLRALAGDTRIALTGRWRTSLRLSELHAALALPQLDFLPELTGHLRRLQHQLSVAASASPLTVQVLPQPGRGEEGNGCLLGMWVHDVQTARELSDRFFSLGVPSWHPSEGDLHLASSWPTHATGSRVDLGSYLDIGVPYLPEEHHDAFLAVFTDTLSEVAHTRGGAHA